MLHDWCNKGCGMCYPVFVVVHTNESLLLIGRKEMFYLQLYGVRHMVKDHSDREREREREETCCCHMGYSFRLAARVILYAPSHRQDSTYHDLCCTSRGALAGTRNGLGDVLIGKSNPCGSSGFPLSLGNRLFLYHMSDAI